MAGNGGQTVVCGPKIEGLVSYQPEQPGVYSFDYLQFHNAYDYIKPESLDVSFDHIEAMLKDIPEALSSFKDFRALIDNKLPSKGNRIWTPSDSELEEIRDTVALRRLPENCRSKIEGDGLGAFQIIIRRVEGEIVFYETYVPLILKIKSQVLQASMLYVHEWLWDYAKSAYQSARFNVFLHSKDATPSEAAAYFVKLGLGVKTNIDEKPVPLEDHKPGSKILNHAELPRYKNSYGMEFVKIPAGTFVMGSDPNKEERHVRASDEIPHEVTLSNPYYMMTTEVTQLQLLSVIAEFNRSRTYSFQSFHSRETDCPDWHRKFGRQDQEYCPRLPAENLSHGEMLEFIGYLNRKGEGFYRLPTEAEWEFAARGFKSGPYGMKGDVAEFAWYKGNSGRSGTRAVGTMSKANDFGLYDMHGNVWEMVSDIYQEYSEEPQIDPLFQDELREHSRRVYRGGGFDSTAGECRSARRLPYVMRPSHQEDWNDLGFRLVVVPPVPHQ